MVFEYLTVSKKKILLLTVKYSKTIETQVKKMWDDNWSNGMTTGFDLVRNGSVKKKYRQCSVRNVQAIRMISARSINTASENEFSEK